MAEDMPAAVLVRHVESGIRNRHIECRRVRLFAKLVVVQNLYKHQVSDLLDDRQGVSEAGRPENVPNAVNLVFEFTGDHSILHSAIDCVSIAFMGVPEQPPAYMQYTKKMLAIQYEMSQIRRSKRPVFKKPNTGFDIGLWG